LYRAIELRGQVAFEAALGTSTSKVPPAHVPEALRDEYQRRYGDPESALLRLPLAATYRVLDALGDAAGVLFRQRKQDFDQLLEARNASILAHGLVPLGAERAQRLLDLVLALMPPDLVERPRFPRLQW
jgi:hypothetical protein